MRGKMTDRRNRRRSTKEPRNIVDIIAREIVRVCPQAISRLLDLHIDPSELHVENPTIHTRNRQVDNVIFIREHGEDVGGILVEWVSQPDNDDLIDYIEKWSNLLAKYRFPMILLVIYLKRGGRASFPDRYVSKLGNWKTYTQFVAINLFDYIGLIESGEWIEFASLIPVCRGLDHLPRNKLEAAETISVIQTSHDLIMNAAITDDMRTLLLGSLFSVSTKSLPQETLLEIFRKDITMLKDTPIIRDWIRESKEDGIRIGTEGVRRSTLRLIKSKFIDIPESLEIRIRNADMDWCDRLSERIMSIESLDQIDLDTI